MTRASTPRSEKYEAQVEWEYRKRTLSISCHKMAADSENSGMGVPETRNSRTILTVPHARRVQRPVIQ
ncbi:hypothetical protein BGZ63DRAFT_386720 [Mariannaea sp. PMI_226]|nr:hypothetical protein BGZ63DRAFT_386720 [Mariannaea sp. PMI_226]